MSRRRHRSTTAWVRFLTGLPSRRFLFWVRCLLFAGWVALIIHEGPTVVRRFNEIRAITAPDFDRSAALQRVVIDALQTLVALPALIVALFGYGIVLHKTPPLGEAGGPRFGVWWTPTDAKPRRRVKRGD